MKKISLSLLTVFSLTVALNACNETNTEFVSENEQENKGLILSVEEISTAQKITFKASDGLEITADLYMTDSVNRPFIILFHQAGWSRGEYNEIAPKLNKMGYNCLAVDQRSGGEINGVINETNQRAKKQKLGTKYTDAEVDIISAIKYVKEKYTKAKKLIIWGSSYSSALVLKIAGDRNDIDAVLSFAPGEYFESMGKPADYISQSAKNITVPVFITSMKPEKPNWWDIYELIPSIGKDYFIPKTAGQHGSRALWEKFPEHKNYWKAVTTFLNRL